MRKKRLVIAVVMGSAILTGCASADPEEQRKKCENPDQPGIVTSECQTQE